MHRGFRSLLFTDPMLAAIAPRTSGATPYVSLIFPLGDPLHLKDDAR